MDIGKISNSNLEEYVFNNIKKYRKEVLSGPDVGTDTAVLDFKEDLIVVSTDPITGATSDLGKLAVNVSCNDVVCECAEPVGVLITILLPPDASLEDLEKIIKDASKECKKLNAEIIGGHTEVTDAVNRIVVSTTVLGKVRKEDIPCRKDIKAGDIVAVSKDLGIEGTAIIYNEHKSELDKILSQKEKEEILSLSDKLSVVKESLIARKYNVKHLHDVTEGGIYGAVWETANAIERKIIMDFDKIPVKNITNKISEYYNINPYRLISSGSLIMIFSEEDYADFKDECDRHDLKVSAVGRVCDGKNAFLIKNGIEVDIEAPGTDELYKVV